MLWLYFWQPCSHFYFQRLYLTGIRPQISSLLHCIRTIYNLQQYTNENWTCFLEIFGFLQIFSEFAKYLYSYSILYVMNEVLRVVNKMRTSLSVCAYMFVCVCVCVCVCACMFADVFVCSCAYMCLCVCAYICSCVDRLLAQPRQFHSTDLAFVLGNYLKQNKAQNQHTRELISPQKMFHKSNNKDMSRLQ